MSDIGKKTFLASVFDAIVNERLEYLQKISYMLYFGILIFAGYSRPMLFTRDRWGELDAKVFVIATTAFGLLWGRFSARMEVKASREALHYGTEKQMEWITALANKAFEKPTTVVNIDNDGPEGKSGPEWSVNPGSREDREFPAHEEGLHREERFGGSLGTLFTFNKK